MESPICYPLRLLSDHSESVSSTFRFIYTIVVKDNHRRFMFLSTLISNNSWDNIAKQVTKLGDLKFNEKIGTGLIKNSNWRYHSWTEESLRQVQSTENRQVRRWSRFLLCIICCLLIIWSTIYKKGEGGERD